jgi:hypothetical protein
MRRMRIAVTVLVALLVAPGIVGATPLIANGGFETGDFSNWTISGNLGFVKVLPGFVHTGNFAAANGAVGTLGYISQLVNTVPGAVYDVSFWLSNYAAPNGSVLPNYFELLAGNQSIFSLSNFPLAFPYTNFTGTFTANSTQTNVQFAFRQDPWAWFLDDVSATQRAGVPEPLSLGLVGTGLLALGLLRRKRA